MQDYLVREFDR